MDSQNTHPSEASLEGILRDLKKGIISPCYLLYGDDDYRIQSALGRIMDALLPPEDRSFNLTTSDSDQENLSGICEFLLTIPLIPAPKVAILRNTHIFKSKKNIPELIQKIRSQLDKEQGKAGRDFMIFLNLVGWSIDDLKDDGWQKIDHDQWEKMTDSDGADRDKWLPRIIEITLGLGLDKTPALSQAGGADRLEKLLDAGIPEGNTIILTTDVIDKRKKLFKVVSEVGKVLSFLQPKGEAKQKNLLMETSGDLLTQKGKKLAPGAWEAIGRKTGFQLRNSMAALEKLIVYTAEKTSITAADVEELIGKTKEETIFDFTTAIAGRNIGKGLLTLQELLDQGVHALVILTMLVREIRNLLYAKVYLRSGQLSSFQTGMDYGRFTKAVHPQIKNMMATDGTENEGLAGQHPYVVYLALKNTERFSYEELLRYLDLLLDLDLAMKTSGRDQKRLMERFIIEVCKGTC